MSWDPTLSLAFTTGVAALVGGAVAWKVHTEHAKLEESKEKELIEVVHLIKVDDLEPLLLSEDERIRKEASQFLILRASRIEHLKYILQQCLSDDLLQVVKAVTAVYLITKGSDENKAKLLNAKAMLVLPKVLGKISDDFNYQVLMAKCKHDLIVEKIISRCVACIFYFTLDDTLTTLSFCAEKSCIRNIFLNIIGDNGYYISTDLKRWATFLIHQLVQCDLHPIKKSLRKWGVVRKVTFCLIKTLGDLLQTTLCLQILVQYLNDSVEEIEQVCQEMTTLGISPHLVGLLRCDEEESIIQLAAVIIHHFCCFDIDTSHLSSTPGIIKTLYTVLNNTDASIQKTILRICNYLVVSSSKFRRNLLNHKPMIKKLAICLASGNKDVVYGSLMLIHDLAMPGKKAVQKLIQANHEIVKSLVTLSLSSTGETAQLIAETLGYICSCESLHSLILRHGVVKTILHFTTSVDVSVQFWASALLLNLSMISDEVKETIIRSGGVHILLEMAVSGDEVELPDIAINATKTLVSLGFLDANIKVQLVSGLEGSIIIDGTERCPGKQGINLVSLDFMHFKYSKGQVIQPSEFQSYICHHFETMKSDPVFLVTQGDCTVLNSDEEIPSVIQKHIDTGKEGFMFAPAWCLILTPNNSREMCSKDNFEFNVSIPMMDFISSLLKENFTDPLIDVLLSMPPSSNISKTEELELIEILARHSFQRQNIVSSTGFLEYLAELIWSVSSLKSNKLSEPENSTKVSHCVAALKILHACSIDKLSVTEIVQRSSMIRALQSLLISIVPSLINKDLGSGTESNMKLLEYSEQKPAWFDLIESSKEDQIMDKDLADEFNETDISEINDGDFTDISCLGRLDSEISESNDDIFHDLENESGYIVPINGESRQRVVTYADNVQYFEEEQTDNVELNHTQSPTHGSRSPVPSPRMRADSFIVRSDSRNMRLDQYRSQSVQEYSLTVDPTEGSTPVFTPVSPSISRSSRPVPFDHQQLRRISRSMSTSLQQSKSTDGVIPELVHISAVLKQLVKHTVIIIYHILHHADKNTHKQILSSHMLPLLLNILGCLNGTFRQRVGLAISALLQQSTKCIENENKERYQLQDDVYVMHTSFPKSCIISANGLEVANENWFFETVIGNQAIGQSLYTEDGEHPAGWYYEVLVLTDGILQIGWANDKCEFNAEKGIGVGDNLDSCGYDGARCKLWNGPSRDIIQNNDYGVVWQPGDVISVILSWDGVLSFWLNGKDLGIALKDIDTERLWYPAVSLSIDQQCVFSFRDCSLRHKQPDRYHTVSEVLLNLKENTECSLASSSQKNQLYVDDSFVFYDTNEKCIMYYYEVEMVSYPDHSSVDIGYVKAVSTELAELGDNENHHLEKLLLKVSNIITKNGSQRKANVIGCGIALPSYDLVITKDGERVHQKPIKSFSEIFKDGITNDEFLIDLIPYISDDNGKVNFGQTDFVFEEANSVMSKHRSIEHVCSLINRVD